LDGQRKWKIYSNFLILRLIHYSATSICELIDADVSHLQYAASATYFLDNYDWLKRIIYGRPMY